MFFNRVLGPFTSETATARSKAAPAVETPAAGEEKAEVEQLYPWCPGKGTHRTLLFFLGLCQVPCCAVDVTGWLSFQASQYKFRKGKDSLEFAAFLIKRRCEGEEQLSAGLPDWGTDIRTLRVHRSVEKMSGSQRCLTAESRVLDRGFCSGQGWMGTV